MIQPQLVYSRRWITPRLAALLGLLYLPLAWAVFAAARHPETFGPGIRLFLPFFVLFSYLLAALVFNRRHARVHSSGVDIRLLPFPLGNGRSIPRNAIAACYHRPTPDYAKGHQISLHHAAGIQTVDAELLDLLSHCPTEAESAAGATAIAQVLNANTASPLIEIRPPLPAKPGRPSIVAFALWVALLLLSIAAGAAWELSAGTL